MRVAYLLTLTFLSCLACFSPCQAAEIQKRSPAAIRESPPTAGKPVQVLKNGSPLCNSDAFNQVPGNPDLFVGRVLQNTSADICSGQTWGLGLFQMNWATSTLEFLRYILAPNAQFTSAYDPAIVLSNGEYWVAFECVGPSIPGVATCMGPLNLSGGIDLSRVTTVISGASSAPSSPYLYSASAPKLLSFQGSIYLYWTVVKMQKNGQWLNLTTRGMRVQQETAGDLRRFWAAGSAGVPVASFDPARNSEVLGVVADDPTANNVADAFQVYTDGTTIFMTAGVGGLGCLSPTSASYGCYRMRIASSETPLGEHVFNGNRLKSPVLPPNPCEYGRIIETEKATKSGTRKSVLMGSFFAPQIPGVTYPNQIATGFQLLPIDPEKFQWTSEAFADLPSRIEKFADLRTTLSQLRVLQPLCDPARQTSAECRSGMHRFCQSQGFDAGGFDAGNSRGLDILDIRVRCVPSGLGQLFHASFPELGVHKPGCSQSGPASPDCDTAVDHYCLARGFKRGFGIVEHSGQQVLFTCLRNTQPH